MTDDRFELAQAVKAALEKAEARHPDSHSLAILHVRLERLLEDHRGDLTDDQFTALGGGTDKTRPPE